MTDQPKLSPSLSVPASASKPTWKQVLDRHAPVLLPAAHDGLSARLIEQAGFVAYQIGGFAYAGAHFGYPDIDLIHYGEISAGVRDLVVESSLPVMIDADDGYGDAKNVTRTVRGYEALGVSAMFLEDQAAPKRCGHMEGKRVIPADVMAGKVRAAVAARRNPDTFLIARTDARESDGLDEALRRGELYLKCGADGLFIEAPHTVEELEKIAKTFAGTPLIANMLEGGGRTPILTPTELGKLGFAMITYPTSIIFRVAKTIQMALADLRAGRPLPTDQSLNFETYEAALGLPAWREIESEYSPSPDAGTRGRA